MPRSRHRAGQRPYQDPSFQNWRREAGYLMRAAVNKIKPGLKLKGSVSVEMALGPDSVTLWIDSEVDDERHGLRGDLDNYAKAILDVMQDVELIADDSQVVHLGVGFIEPDEEEE